MDTRQHLDAQRLRQLSQLDSIDDADTPTIVEFFRAETGLAASLPNGELAIDPRTGARVLYSPARARRPRHIKRPISPPASVETCPICNGETTGIVDSAPLSEGATFINKNLFPMLYPFELAPARGLHLLQWTSSYHDVDWHNLGAEDRVVVMERLAALERKFIQEPSDRLQSDEGETYVSIIKNVGATVGASLAHGHQQIAISNVPPARTLDNMHFAQAYGRTFSAQVQDGLDPSLIVVDYGEALLLVPPFIKRPLEMLLVMRDPARAFLHQLTPDQLQGFANGWHDACLALVQLMPALDMEIAFNVTVSNGPGAGLYAEFLPRTQATGGFEKLGLFVCQGTPASSAGDLRDALAQSEPE